ncbi:MAG: competence/damage-inducible protein A [Legionella sp.]|nr:competence/damage-inducible protein A [Legionella sp.]
MAIAILATGDEIIHGDTLNTNGREIAHILSSEGLPLGLHMSCPDKEGDIYTCLQFLTQAHDILIIIGGLGPTTDDITRFALSKWTDDPLIQHTYALEEVQKRLAKAQINMNPGHFQQCLFPATAILLPNPQGTAVGCYYQWKHKSYILLPGPPRECLPMFSDYALPLLSQVTRSQKEIIKWRIFGLSEGEIAAVLEKALAPLDCQTGYRLEEPYIEFKVRCKPTLIPAVKAIIDPILHPHCITTGSKKASEQLLDLIVSMKQSITIIDEATGGLLQTLLSRPATKEFVLFHDVRKTQFHFHLKGLDEYWCQKSAGFTDVIIEFAAGGKEGMETHKLPYRSPLVVNYAAEWLCFRLFHLINQLHQCKT